MVTDGRESVKGRTVWPRLSPPTMAQNLFIRLAAIAGIAAAMGSRVLAGGPSESVLRPPGFDLKTWHSEDGLPSDGVNALAQTEDGYLWICTNAGLARFDGARFTVFDRRSTPELGSDQCGPLHVDADGALWIATMGGGLNPRRTRNRARRPQRPNCR